APVERVDIADWLLHLPDAEYRRCAPPDHIAAGTTTTDDGRLMSINVEVIGGSLMVQHYVAEIHEPYHCRMVSLSDVQTPAGWKKDPVIRDPRRPPPAPTRLPIPHPGAHPPAPGFPGAAQGRGDLVQRCRGRPPSRECRPQPP